MTTGPQQLEEEEGQVDPARDLGVRIAMGLTGLAIFGVGVFLIAVGGPVLAALGVILVVIVWIAAILAAQKRFRRVELVNPELYLPQMLHLDDHGIIRYRHPLGRHEDPAGFSIRATLRCVERRGQSEAVLFSEDCPTMVDVDDDLLDVDIAYAFPAGDFPPTIHDPARTVEWVMDVNVSGPGLEDLDTSYDLYVAP